MVSLGSLVGLSVLARSIAAAFPWDVPHSHLASRQTSPSQNISWTPCHAPNYECAVYQPPLDYANPAAGTARIAVVRYKATKTPKLGTLFTNPGGPGVSGVGDVMATGGRTSNYTGGYYDIVGWDPRGINNSLPSSFCFETSAEENKLWTGSIHSLGIDSKGAFKDQADLAYFYGQATSFDTKLKTFGQQCQTFNPNFKYMGTAATVRDIVGMADILDGPGSPINYWGVSYGTLIGSYLVNMFPNRVGRVILDSVVDPVAWSTWKPHTYARSAYQDSETAFNGYCEACAAGKSQCALSNNGALSGPQIKTRILKMIDDIYDAAKLGFDYRSQWIRDDIFSALYSPRLWDETADILAQLEEAVGIFLASPALKRDAKTPSELSGHHWRVTAALPSGKTDTTRWKRQRVVGPYDHSFEGITCVDAIDPGAVTTKDVFDEIVSVTHDITPTFGASFTIAGYYCHAFPVRAVERYIGPFNNKLTNPILIIGNKADPITPYASAKALADGLGDSATLIQRDGWGHYSGGMLSNCTISAVATYLIGGELPSKDEFCQTNQPLFIPGLEPSSFDGVTTVAPVPVPTGTPVSGPATGTSSSGSGSTESGSSAIQNPLFLWSLSAVLCALTVLGS